MSTKIVSRAVLAAYLLVAAAPVVAFAAEPPKTKADCEKVKDMKWNDKTNTCEKKK